MRAVLQLLLAAVLAAAAVVLGGRQWAAALLVVAAGVLAARVVLAVPLATLRQDLDRLRGLVGHAEYVLAKLDGWLATLGTQQPETPQIGKPLRVKKPQARDVR